VWILQLNDMRDARVEWMTPVCCADSREELEAFVEREKVEPYKDGTWGKSFRQGGPLEWFNQPFCADNNIFELRLPTVAELERDS
jgi:hypothetical protein